MSSFVIIYNISIHFDEFVQWYLQYSAPIGKYMADMANDSYSNMMDKYLLVSDSNEIGGQYDSKKLKHSELIDLMQDNLYRKKLDIMQQYLTVDQFNTYK